MTAIFLLYIAAHATPSCYRAATHESQLASLRLWKKLECVFADLRFPAGMQSALEDCMEGMALVALVDCTFAALLSLSDMYG
jgi:hypothetical protein